MLAKMVLQFVIWMAMVGLPWNSSADESNHRELALVKQAIAATESVVLGKWGYTVTSVNDGKTRVEKFDPTEPKTNRWQLVLKNGKAPGSKDLRNYTEERLHRPSGAGPQGLGIQIDKSSLQVVSNDTARIICSFRLKADDDESRLMAANAKGTLVVSRMPLFVESLQVTNTGRISSSARLSIREFNTRVQFRPDPKRGDPLMVSHVTRVRGRLLLVKSLNVESAISYKDFRWMGDKL